MKAEGFEENLTIREAKKETEKAGSVSDLGSGKLKDVSSQR